MVPVLRESTPYEIVRVILDEAATNNVLVEGLPELPGALYPTSEQVRTTGVLGHDIGCHGHQHLKRATITANLFLEDLEHARDILSSLLGVLLRAFPFSSHMPLTYYVPRFTWPGPARLAADRHDLTNAWMSRAPRSGSNKVISEGAWWTASAVMRAPAG